MNNLLKSLVIWLNALVSFFIPFGLLMVYCPTMNGFMMIVISDIVAYFIAVTIGYSIFKRLFDEFN